MACSVRLLPEPEGPKSTTSPPSTVKATSRRKPSKDFWSLMSSIETEYLFILLWSVHRTLLPSRGLRQSAGTITPYPALPTIGQGKHPKGEHQEKKRRLAGGGIVQRLYFVIDGNGDGTGDPRDVTPNHQDYPKLAHRMGEA